MIEGQQQATDTPEILMRRTQAKLMCKSEFSARAQVARDKISGDTEPWSNSWDKSSAVLSSRLAHLEITLTAKIDFFWSVSNASTLVNFPLWL